MVEWHEGMAWPCHGHGDQGTGLAGHGKGQRGVGDTVDDQWKQS